MAFWLVLSLTFSAYFASEALRQAFSSEYVAQDDARQHVFWMYRYVDAELFPHDLIADYFQSVAPLGYSTFYRLLVGLGLDPLLASKLLPMALGLITTGYCFGVSLQLFPVPGAAFFSTLILNQSIWMQDDLASATPRAFVYPLFLGFLCYLLRGSLGSCLLLIGLQALFYPSIAFISVGILMLRLLCWENKRLRFSRIRRDYLLSAAGLGIFLLILLSYSMKTSGFGPVIAASEAGSLPEFLPGGRTNFFGYGFWRYWITGSRSGMLSESLLTDVPIYAGLLLPVLLCFPRRFPLAQKITRRVTVLPRILVASLFMFFAAHALLFRLHHPNRYTAYTVRMVMALAAGIALIIILDVILQWAKTDNRHALLPKLLAAGTAMLMVAAIVLFPKSLASFPNAGYRVGHTPAVYEFYSRQPKDVLIASLAQEVKNIPIYAKRSILVSREYSLPFHKEYYGEMSRRASDLIHAHYTPDLAELQAFLRKYRITLLLVERSAFSPEYLSRDGWLMQYQPAAEAILKLRQGEVPALSRLMKSSSVFETEDYVVLDAESILKTSPN